MMNTFIYFSVLSQSKITLSTLVVYRRQIEENIWVDSDETQICLPDGTPKICYIVESAKKKY